MMPKILCLSYLAVISFCDIRTYRIPNSITLGFSVLSIFLTFLTEPQAIPARLSCAVLFFALFFAVAVLTNGLGKADIKMAAVLAFNLGFFKTAAVFISACLAGILFIAVSDHVFRTAVRKIPLAPFVTAGYIVTQVCFGRFL